ncbi:ATP-dependent RNA helicase SrmB [Candidatus Methylobacter favarea]|uniref:ATP-dependent RNA helicase SrmB n=1 Tax=Candidatus Methylobacter favarea TaxID=2707345 RepID=A0A8S0X1G9_9GAMM|nr:DEAD/DEAH box helicase [Candidatus Methylobacter favarea]CAA9891228.1 ATP-dependent RNA helicase SrmB [Candidatus Methylobacter favarea]
MFSYFSLAEQLLLAVNKLGFDKPTPVQIQAIPLAMEHKDLLVSAETGSGKTAAFLLPTLHRLITLPSTKFGTRALILAPTRELARQTFTQCRKLAEFTSLKVGLVTGGDDFKHQQGMIRRNAEIIISTPGRLLELIEQESLDFSHLDVLILDEADRMLDMGFSEAVLAIAGRCNSQRQTLLFSATLTHYGVIKIADRILKNHKVVALNTLYDGHSNIEQQIVLADDNEHKQKLLAWLLLNETYNKALVFTNTRIKANELQGPLRGQKLRVGVLHGEMDQKDRNRMMELFRAGEVNIMIATDLAARGLDVKGINLVINFDIPRNGIDYIHRIGRTGRIDELGLTIALVKATEWNLMAGIERFLKQKFKRRNIKDLQGKYKGPKKLKASGKAAGIKKKIEPKKAVAGKVKIRHRDQKNIGKRRVPGTKPASTEN